MAARAALSLLLAAALLAAAGCGRGESPAGEDDGAESHPMTGPLEPQEPVDRVEVQNSGRTMNGTYTLRAPVGRLSVATYVFTKDGGYSRAMVVGGGQRGESGTYVIDEGGRLVLFVERRGDAQSTSVERETFGLSGDPAGTILVTPPGGETEEYVRTGDPPAQGGPRVE